MNLSCRSGKRQPRNWSSSAEPVLQVEARLAAEVQDSLLARLSE